MIRATRAMHDKVSGNRYRVPRFPRPSYVTLPAASYTKTAVPDVAVTWLLAGVNVALVFATGLISESRLPKASYVQLLL